MGGLKKNNKVMYSMHVHLSKLAMNQANVITHCQVHRDITQQKQKQSKINCINQNAGLL